MFLRRNTKIISDQVRVHLTEQFIAQFDAAEIAVQKAVTKQLKLLSLSIRHPSLHAKNTMKEKMSGRRESTAVGDSIFLSKKMFTGLSR